MRAGDLFRTPWRAGFGPTDRKRLRIRPRALSPEIGLEALDQMGIDIDQDPRAFAQFLELRNRLQQGRG